MRLAAHCGGAGGDALAPAAPGLLRVMALAARGRVHELRGHGGSQVVRREETCEVSSLAGASASVTVKSLSPAWERERAMGRRRDGKHRGDGSGGEKGSGSLPNEAVSLIWSCWPKLRIAEVSSDKSSRYQ